MRIHTLMQRHASKGKMFIDSDRTTVKTEAAQSQPLNAKRQLFEPLLTEVQAGELLGLHPKTIQRLARLGEVPAIRIGRYWRFRASLLNAWIELQSTGQPACVGEPQREIQ
jgi:excisionase family DNA binding protein